MTQLDGDMSFMGFDAERVTPQAAKQPLPAGKYLVHVARAEVRATRKGDGRLIVIAMEVTRGTTAGHWIWCNILVEHPSAEAVERGRATLSALCRAIGVLRPCDTSELVGRALGVEITLKNRKDDGGQVNEIVEFIPLPGQATAAPQATQPAPQPAPAAAAPVPAVGTDFPDDDIPF